jgi:predicted PurR-regulated permease PerM
MSTPLLMSLMAATALYCVVQALRDFRRKNYVWGAIGVALTLAILAIPVPTHAVKIDLPIAQ